MDQQPTDVYSLLLLELPIESINHLAHLSKTLSDKTAEVRERNMYWKERLENEFETVIDYHPLNHSWNHIYNKIINGDMSLSERLPIAVREDDMDTLLVLLSLGASDVKLYNELKANGGGSVVTALRTAAQLGKMDFVETFLAIDETNKYILESSLRDTSDVDIFRMLLHAYDSVYGDKKEFLRRFTIRSKITSDILEASIEEGYDVHDSNEAALSYFSSSCQTGHVRVLLKHGADPNADNGEIFLSLVRTSNSVNAMEIIRLFLAYGVNVRMHNDKALVEAIKSENESLVHMLLTKGCSVNVVDEELVEDIVKKGKVYLLESLIDYGLKLNDPNSLFILSVDDGKTEMIKFLLKNGADVNTRNGKALLIAVRNEDIKTVKLLLDKGADVNARNGAILAEAENQRNRGLKKLLLKYVG